MVAAFAIASAILGQTANAGSKSKSKSNPNSILKGTYAGAGTLLQWFTPNGGSAEKLDVAFASVATFDGAGNENSTVTLTDAPTSSAASPTTCVETTTATYSVNADGSGTLTENSTVISGGCPNLDNLTFNIAVSGGGNTVCVVGTFPSITLSSGVINSSVSSFCATRQ